jgi:FAS-associated factor 2
MAMIYDLVVSAISLPLRLLTNILRLVFNLVGIPFPQIYGYSRIFRPGSSITRTGSDGPEQWLRELEEETGAVCVLHYSYVWALTLPPGA